MRKYLVVAAVAIVAAFVIAGTASATKLITGSQVKNSSLTGSDVKNSSLTGSDIKNHSLTAADFRGSITGPAGPKGDTGSTGSTGAQGTPGLQGPPGPLLDALPAGKTLRGAYGIAAFNAGDLGMTGISYSLTLPSVPTVHVIQAGGATPAGCTGTSTAPGAVSGNLCVFEQAGANHAATYPTFVTNTRFGAGLYLFPTAAGFAYSTGVWAVTA